MNSIEMSSIASLLMPSTSNIATTMISKKDTNSDSELSIEEMGISSENFSLYDTDSDGLVSQSELTSAIDSKMSELEGKMPSKEDFQTMLSELGFEAPEGMTSSSGELSSSQLDTISSVLATFDANSLSASDAQSIVTAFQKVGIEPSEELATAMENAGFDAQEVGTLAGVATQGQSGMTGAPSGGGGGGMSSSEEEEVFDVLDTNEDGTVSFDELEEYYGTDEQTSSLSTNQQNALDNLGVLMDILKSGSEDEDSSVDSENFDGLLKAINNQNNNSEINSYLEKSNTSSLFSYA